MEKDNEKIREIELLRKLYSVGNIDGRFNETLDRISDKKKRLV